jgi:hypothetical protein
MDEDLAEAARERLVPVSVEALIAEEDDAMVEERPPDGGDRGVVEVGVQVGAVNLGRPGRR